MKKRIKRVQTLSKNLTQELFYRLNFITHLSNVDETTLANLESLISEIKIIREKEAP